MISVSPLNTSKVFFTRSKSSGDLFLYISTPPQNFGTQYLMLSNGIAREIKTSQSLNSSSFMILYLASP